MSKDFKNTINSVRNDVQFDYVDNTSTSLLRIGGAFLFSSIQPFIWACDYIDTNQLKEVTKMWSKSANLITYQLLSVSALLAVTLDLNQIVSDGESNR